MSQRIEMFERGVGSDFIVDDDGADGIGFEFASDHDGGDAAFFEIGEDVDVDEQPVGQDDEGFDAAVEQHFEIALEAAALVVNVGEDGQVGRLVESVLDAAENQSAVGIGHVEDHDADGVAALAAQGAGKQVGTVAELLGGAFDAFLGGVGDVAGQRSVVQNNGNGGGGEAALFGDVADGDHGCCLRDGSSLRGGRILRAASTAVHGLEFRLVLADTTAESEPVSSSGLRVGSVLMVRAALAEGCATGHGAGSAARTAVGPKSANQARTLIRSSCLSREKRR